MFIYTKVQKLNEIKELSFSDYAGQSELSKKYVA